MLKGKTVQQIVRFLLAAGFSACFTLGLPALLHEVFKVEAQIAVGVSLVVAFMVNFVTTRFYVFKSKGDHKREMALYTVSNLSFRVLEYGFFWVLHEIAGIWYMAALIVVLGVSMVCKFIVYKFFVFKPLVKEPEAF